MNHRLNHITERNISVANRSTSRIINQKTLLDIICESDGISKTDLANILGLSKPAVSKNVDDLISMGLIEERGEGKAGKNGGRKPILLHFNPTYCYICVLDISTEIPVCAIGDLNHRILRVEKMHIDRNSSADKKKTTVTKTIENLMKSLNASAEKLEYIVISHPGIIGKDGEAFFTEVRHHPWTEIGLKPYLEQNLHIPVMLKNNVRLASIGEMYMGTDSLLNDLIYVDCSIGLGSSIIMNRKLHEGSNYAAGEMGYFLMSNGQRAEDLIAMDSLITRIAKLYKENGLSEERLSFREIVNRSRSGDILVNQVLREIGRELGRIIFDCSIFVDIPTVIFGGDYLKLGPALFEGIEETVSQDLLPFRPNVVKSSLREAAGIFGGLVVGRDEILQKKLSKVV